MPKAWTYTEIQPKLLEEAGKEGFKVEAYKERKTWENWDILTKEYMKRLSVFADVLNQFIYKGREVIHPDRLIELDTTEITIPYGGSQASVPVQKYRDVSKILTAMTDQKAAYCILAVENEGKINYAMPVKNELV